VIRQTGATKALLFGAALCSAGFWILAAVIGSFFGVAGARHPLWIPSQLLHVLGALLVIPAIPGLTLFARRPDDRLATWAASLAMIGSALFAADGLIALSVFPILADNARELLEPLGAMNRGLMLATYIVVGAVNTIGWILVAVALWGGRAPNWATGLLVVGAALFNLPSGLVPMLVRALGGLLWSAALLRFATDESLSRGNDTAPMRRIRPMPPRTVHQR
jgi:hypothetical protein